METEMWTSEDTAVKSLRFADYQPEDRRHIYVSEIETQL